jgi:tetratricopeptide (TPR) repeat protein
MRKAKTLAEVADVLFNDARAAMAVKKFDVACEKFRESNRLDPAVGTLFNLANCEAQRGQLVTAWTLYRQVLEKLPPDDPRASVARRSVNRWMGASRV